MWVSILWVGRNPLEPQARAPLFLSHCPVAPSVLFFFSLGRSLSPSRAPEPWQRLVTSVESLPRLRATGIKCTSCSRPRSRPCQLCAPAPILSAMAAMLDHPWLVAVATLTPLGYKKSSALSCLPLRTLELSLAPTVPVRAQVTQILVAAIVGARPPR